MCLQNNNESKEDLDSGFRIFLVKIMDMLCYLKYGNASLNLGLMLNGSADALGPSRNLKQLG